jgi:uncharacterized protein with ParB-like and HNH nuclease domain
MAKQIPAHPDKKSISDLIGKIIRNELVLQPEFQREFVWTHIHMEKFIQTILDGFPFPEIYISQKGINLDTLVTQNVVVDGQQRLTTIKRYIEGTYNFEKNIPKYANLGQQEKTDFLNYDVTVRDLKDASPSTIIEIFKRINSTNFTLTAIEINKAIYNGEFISCAKHILDLIKQDKLEIDIFSESELTRMADLHFILLVLSTIEEGGYFTRDNNVEKYIAMFNEVYPNYDKNRNMLSHIIVTALTSQLTDDSIWFRKSNFFTLVVELYFSEVELNNVFQRLVDFESVVLQNKNEDKVANEYALYYSSMYTGTNSRQARVIRGSLFRKHILGLDVPALFVDVV